MLKRLQQQGITMVISTSYMDEATLCDRIGLIENGQLLSVDSPKNIIKKYPYTLYAIKAEKTYQLLKDLRLFPEIANCYSFGEYIHFLFKETNTKQISILKKYLQERGHEHVELLEIEPTIEDCFIANSA